MKPYPLSLLNHLTVPVSGIPTSGCLRAQKILQCSGRLPDQSAVHPYTLKSDRLIECDCRHIEVIDEQCHVFAAPEQVSADFAQEGPGETAAAELRMGP